ncbi:MAG: hypothetical protein KGN84_02605, partial [Acidobacteriota bacterium]|nr:hypothetical protein [Acidobacteriota bacterium]
MRLFIALLACGSVWGAVGSATFSGGVTPQSLTAKGGILTLSTQVSSPYTILAVNAEVRFPSGDTTDAMLAQNPAGTWSGTVAIGPNLTRFDQYPQVVFSAQDTTLAWSRSDAVAITLQGEGPNAPRIDFTGVPAIGSPSAVTGITANADPAQTVFVMNLFVPGLGYYTKPYCSGGNAQPVPLIGDGTLLSVYATGGADLLATEIIGYLFPRGVTIPCLMAAESVPASFTANALAMVSRKRVPSASLPFAGTLWAVKAPGVQVGPGNNYFLASNVFIDSRGLHLRETPCKMGSVSTWCSGEVFLTQPTGYGTYKFDISGPLGSLSSNDVLGLYLYGDRAGFGHHELDFELFRQTDQMNAQFVVQP